MATNRREEKYKYKYIAYYILMFSDLIIGGTAACIARTATAPLELYKIQCQNRYLPDATLSQVWKKEGFRYFWKGNGINCARAFPQFGINYGTFQFAKKYICSGIEMKRSNIFMLVVSRALSP